MEASRAEGRGGYLDFSRLTPGELLRFTKDPLGDLEAGRYDALVAAELDQAGLRPR